MWFNEKGHRAARRRLTRLFWVVVAMGAITGCSMLFNGSGLVPFGPNVDITVRVPATALSGSSLTASAALGTYSDIDSVSVDVGPSAGGGLLVSGQTLTLVGGAYEGTLVGLPSGVSLDFEAHAFDVGGTEIFNGTTVQTLSSSSTVVDIYLSAIDDGATSLPVIGGITVPSSVVAGGVATIGFSVRGDSSETLSYTLTPASSGGSFSPSSGTVTLDGSGVGTFSTTYTGAAVTGVYAHRVTIADASGNVVRQTFETTVSGLTSGLTVYVGPAVTSISAERIGSDLSLDAIVVDDGPATDLRYEWQLDGATFSTSSPATFSGYDETVSGTITLFVTDGAGTGATSELQFPLVAGQFPDSPITYLGTSGGGIALLANTSYVDYSVGYDDSEASNLEATLTSQGFSVATFTDISSSGISAALAGNGVLAIPEQESGSLSSALSSTAISTIQSFVSGGGTLVIFGVYDGSGAGLVNAVGGFTTSESSAGTSAWTGVASGSRFDGAASTLPNNNHTEGLVLSSLPSAAVDVYSDGYVATVVTIPYGSGEIVYLGWDWFDAVPVGSLDGGWLDVLSRAVSVGGSGSTATGIVATDGGSDTFTVYVPWGSSARFDLSLAGDLDLSVEYVSVIVNGTAVGTYYTGYQDQTMRVAATGVDVTSYVTPGTNATVTLDASSSVNDLWGGYAFEYEFVLY